MNDLEGFTDPVNFPGEPPATLMSAARLTWWQLIQRVGRVVSIHRQLNCRACVGLLRPMLSSQQKKKDANATPTKDSDKNCDTARAKEKLQDWNSAMLSPTDSRMPRIVIPKAACPPGEFLAVLLLGP